MARFAGRQLANTAAFFVIASLITPTEFGLASISAGLALIFRICISRGFRDVVIQREIVDSLVLSTAFWLNIALGMILSLTLALSSPLIGAAFGEPRLMWLTLSVSPIPLIAAFTSIQEAQIERAFKHKVLSGAQVIASILSSVAAVALAYAGAGAWALVALAVMETTLIGGSVFAFNRWLPKWEFSWPEARSQVAFAWPVMVSSLLSTGNLRFAQLIVGALIGPAATAHFRVAGQVVQLLNQAIVTPLTQILLPTISRSSAPLGLQAVRAVSVILAISAPAFVGAAAVSPFLIPMVLGETWRPSVGLSAVLCIGAIPAVITAALTPVFIAAGRPTLASSVNAMGAGLGIVGTAIGATVNVLWAGAGFALRGVATVPFAFFQAKATLDARIGELTASVATYSLCSLIMYFSVRLVGDELTARGYSPYIVFAASVSTGIAVYGLAARTLIPRLAPAAYEPLRLAAPAWAQRWL